MTWPDPLWTATLFGLGFALFSGIWPALGRAALTGCSLALAAAAFRRARERLPRASNRFLTASAAAAVVGWVACVGLGELPVWPRALLLAVSTAAVAASLAPPGGGG